MKKTAIISLLIILLFSTVAWALWPAIAIRAGLRVATSQGAKRVVVQAGLSKEAAKQAARLAVVQNQPDLAWKVGSTAAAMLGIHILLSDISGLRQHIIDENPDIYIQTSKTYIMENGVKFRIEGPVVDTSGISYTNPLVWNRWRVYVASGRWRAEMLESERVSSAQPGQWGWITLHTQQPDGSWYTQFPTGLAVHMNYSYDVTSEYTPITDVVTEGVYSEVAIDEWVEENPEAWLNPSLVTNTLTDSAPSGAQDMGVAYDVTIMDEVAPDPVTGAQEDPLTGLDQSTVENPEDEEDKYMAPSQPLVPIFDTSMEIPEKMSIPDRITEFLNNAPFMNVIRNFEVNASSGSSTLSFSLWGRNYNWDFSQYEDHYNKMAVVLLALAYIWSAQIVFGGRA